MQRDADFDERVRAWLNDRCRATNNWNAAAVARALTVGLTPDKLKLLAQRLQEHYDLLEPGAVWERAPVPDPVQVANDCGQQLQDLEPLLAFALDGDPDGTRPQLERLAFTIELLRRARSESEAFEALLRYQLKGPNSRIGRPRSWALQAGGTQPLLHIRATLQACNEAIGAAIEGHILRRNELYDAESA
jgi:hypothetical protein